MVDQSEYNNNILPSKMVGNAPLVVMEMLVHGGSDSDGHGRVMVKDS